MIDTVLLMATIKLSQMVETREVSNIIKRRDLDNNISNQKLLIIERNDFNSQF
jgi:hypothetical protein